MTFDQLKEKALSLPYAPGVYIMRDKENTVIYVGKAKKLKNRVSQYFQDTASHTPKTRLMMAPAIPLLGYLHKIVRAIKEPMEWPSKI